MEKSYFIIDNPCCCAECPMRYLAEEIPLGDFKYRKLFRCKIEPENIEDIYLEDILHKKQEWCPLKSLNKIFERIKMSVFEEPITENGIEVGKVKLLSLGTVNEILNYEFEVNNR